MNEKKLMESFDKLNRRIRRYFDSYFSSLSLSGVQALTLHYIITESAHRDVFSKDLEQFLDIKGASITSLINTLERNGYLRRESLPEDARYKRLVLTDRSRALAPELLEMMAACTHTMFTGIEETQLAAFDAVMQQMTQNISR